MPASNAITPFVFGNEHVIRVVDRDGDPWWVLKDICAALTIVRTDSAARMLDDDERGTHSMSTLGGPQDVTVVNEPGLYRLIMRSDKPVARRFQRWVFHEVLPQIRKTGAYATDGALTESEKLQKAQLLYSVAGKKGAAPLLIEYGWLRDEPTKTKPSVETIVLGMLGDGTCEINEIMRGAGAHHPRFDISQCLERLIANGRVAQRGGIYSLT
jgi:prophage antirepressor-like protein